MTYTALVSAHLSLKRSLKALSTRARLSLNLSSERQESLVQLLHWEEVQGQSRGSLCKPQGQKQQVI